VISILILAFIVTALFIFRRIGLFPNVPLTWDLVWRIFLRILIAFGVLGVIAKVWSLVVVRGHLNTAWLVSPSQNPLIDGISTVIYAVALVGVWRWRKWGAYLIFVRLGLTVFVQVFIYQSLGWQLAAGYTGLDNLYADLSGALTWLLAFFFNWIHFK
jgi:hypothetical protein